MHSEFVKCDCGSTIFKDISTAQFSNDEFMVWSSGAKLKAAIPCVPIVGCIRCNRYKIPITYLAGKNPNDPEAKAYGELVRAVEYHNNTIELLERFLFSESKKDDYIQSKIDTVTSLLSKLDEKIKKAKDPKPASSATKKKKKEVTNENRD